MPGLPEAGRLPGTVEGCNAATESQPQQDEDVDHQIDATEADVRECVVGGLAMIVGAHLIGERGRNVLAMPDYGPCLTGRQPQAQTDAESDSEEKYHGQPVHDQSVHRNEECAPKRAESSLC